MIDKEVTVKHVQSLNSRDAVASFFAYLGYDVGQRTEQRPENLGVTAGSLKQAITHIETVATQDDWLRVILVELKSVTVAHTRTLANSLRNLAGDFLLVLTSDYERIDFVLLERIAPSDGGAMTQKQVKARPRVLTVERRKPDRVALRVLRRLTYSEADPYAQYDKLVSAFDTAEWSEEHFDNRALFSDYYLTERLPDMPEWEEDPRPAFRRFQELFERAQSRWAGKTEGKLRDGLLEPALQTLGFRTEVVKAADDDSPRPDYELHCSTGDGEEPACLCLTYPWGRSLDGKDPTRDSETPEENPGARVVSLLHGGDVPFAIVTNGKLWRLYSSKTHSMSSRFYQLDVPEILAREDPSEAFRYFWLIFRAKAFEPRTEVVEGEEKKTCFAAHLIDQSREYARRLGERLKERVFEQIFPHFAEGFIAHLCAQQDRAAGDLGEEELQEVYRGTLTLLYRLLFLLYAESRDLLPVRETRGYWDVSLTRMKQEIGEQAGTILDETEGKLRRAYSATETTLYERLQQLCRVVDKGERALNVPVYNGGLFITDPDPDDERTEAVTARFLRDNCIPDLQLAFGLDLMARDLDDKTQALAFIDYKSLGVRQLGSIYEGLLEFKVRVAGRDLCVVKEKGTYKYKPKGELTKTQREKLPKARATTVQEGPRKGDVYLENDKRERKATGSYYTPDYIVEYIVEHAVGPVLEEKFAELRPQLRRAETAYGANKSRIGVVEGYSREDAAGEAYEAHKDVVEDLFDVKVLDPAMGSGHFLVETVDFITDRMIDFLNAFPWNPVRELLEQTRRTIQEEMDEQEVNIDPGRLTDVNLLKRHVLKRCVYGVDLNPMAVELAKVSLWLDCFTLGAPLSFLDHHLRCGNSLVGTDVETVRRGVEGTRAGTRLKQMALFAGLFTGLERATAAMAHVGKLTDTTVEQVHDSVRHYRTAQKLLAPYKGLLDVWVSQWFGNEEALDAFRLYPDQVDKAVKAAVREDGRPSGVSEGVWEVVSDSLQVAQDRRFFHWELEFPEARARNQKSSPAGFDAVLGNPPWGQKEISESPGTRVFAEETYSSLAGIYDLFRPFVERGVRLCIQGGAFGMILPDIVLLKDYPCTRRFLLDELALTAIDWWGMAFPDATIDAATVLGRRSTSEAQHEVRATVRAENAPLCHKIPQSDFRANPRFTFNLHLTSEKRAVIEAMEELPKLSDYFEVHEGVHSGNMRAELFVDSMLDETCVPLLFGRDELQPYLLKWQGTYLRLRAYERRGANRYANVGHQEWFDRSKLVVRRTGDKVVAAVDAKRRYASNNFFIVFPRPNCPFDLDGVCALLNSRFMTWYFRTIEPRKGRVFAELKIKHLGSFPLPKSLEGRDACASLVELGRQRREIAARLTEAAGTTLAQLREQAAHLDSEVDSVVRQSLGLTGFDYSSDGRGDA